MTVPADVLWIMGVIAFVLKDIVEALLPQEWVYAINRGLSTHARGAMARIAKDVKAEFFELWGKPTKLKIGVAGIVIPLLLVWIVELFKPLSINPIAASVLLITSAALTCLGVVLLMLPAAKLCATLAFAVPLYSFFLFVSKCRKGAVVAYSLGISLSIFAFQWLSMTP